MIKYVTDLNKKKNYWCLLNSIVGVFFFYLISKIDMFNQKDWAKSLDLT